jgi:tetratricopeptide (TPR) repeat protein
LFRQADLLTQTGHWPEGDQCFRAALELVDAERDPWLYGRALRGVAASAARMGRSVEAAQWLEEALAGYRATGDRLNEMVTSAVLLITQYELGSWDQLVSTAQRTLALARSFGDLVNTGIACQGLGLGALAVGDRTTARAMLAETESCWAAAVRPRMVLGAVNCRGLIAQDDGDHDEAIALYRAAIESARAIGAATEEAYASHDLGALLLELGEPADAVQPLRTSAQHWAETGFAMLQAKSERRASAWRCSTSPNPSTSRRRSLMRDSPCSVPVRSGASTRRAGCGSSRGCSPGSAARPNRPRCSRPPDAS